MKKVMRVSALGLAAIAGQAIGQVTVNGVRSPSEPYALVWSQNQPTSYGDNVPGSIGTAGNPEAVVFGLEMAIPLAALGNPTGGTIRLAGVFGNGSNLSNQVIGADPLPLSGTYNSVAFSGGFPNLGQGRGVNFANDSAFPGNQYLSITIPAVASRSAGLPVFDGQLDGLNGNNGAGGWWAGSRAWIESNYTSLGNSEADNLYVRVSDNGTPGDGSDDKLCLFVGGNFNSYHRLALFFDYEAGGQNRMLFENQNWGFGFIPGISAASAVSTDGLTWDAGFTPDALMIANGNTADQSYYDWFLLPTTPSGAGQGTYLGNVNYGDVGGAILEGAAGAIPTGGTMLSAINNSNNEGVGGSPVGGTLIPSRDLSGGSELDNLYSYIDDNGTPGNASDDEIYLFVGGNLENNFNSLVLFFDADAADGQNVIRGVGATPPNPFFDASNGLNRMGSIVISNPPDPDVITPGLTFEPGFTADYVLRVGNSTSDVYANAVSVRANGRLEVSGFQTEYTSYSGGAKYPSNSPISFPGTFADFQEFLDANDPLETNAAPRTTTNQNPAPFSPIDPQTLTPNVIMVDIDNNNITGVTGVGTGASVAGAADVATGVEIRIRASELNWDGVTPLRIAGFIASADYTNISNQVIGGIQSTGGFFETNLGESSQLDFGTLPGTQFVTLLTGGGPNCDSIDFNNDTSFFDPQDIDAFLSVFSEGDCVPSGTTCNDIDFNNDGSLFDPCDIDSFLLVFSEGPCTMCGV